MSPSTKKTHITSRQAFPEDDNYLVLVSYVINSTRTAGHNRLASTGHLSVWTLKSFQIHRHPIHSLFLNPRNVSLNLLHWRSRFGLSRDSTAKKSLHNGWKNQQEHSSNLTERRVRKSWASSNGQLTFFSDNPFKISSVLTFGIFTC